MNKIIFLGNGLLADYAQSALAPHCDIIFHARTPGDLAAVAELKRQNPSAHAILASFGVIIRPDLLSLFEPEGIINLHPSLLPRYRGASPIETAILHGDTTLGISIMKLAPAMDAGPLYHQESIDFSPLLDPYQPAAEAIQSFYHQNPHLTPIPSNIPSDNPADSRTIKTIIYATLATAGANWLASNLNHLPTPVPQSGEPTFCRKLDKSMSSLLPGTPPDRPLPLSSPDQSAAALHRQIIAHAFYPHSKIAIKGTESLILASHITNTPKYPELSINASDGRILALDRIQPAGKRPMDPQSFKNGYLK